MSPLWFLRLKDVVAIRAHLNRMFFLHRDLVFIIIETCLVLIET